MKKMIASAYYWKEELDRIAGRLERRQHQKRWSSRSEAALEKQVFIGAFAVRKLIESQKAPPRLLSHFVVLTRYPARKKKQIEDPGGHFMQRFEVRRRARIKLTVRELMNQFIHSYYFSPSYPAGNQMVGIVFTSDYAREKCLYYITLLELSAVFRKIGSEVISQQLNDLLAGD
jgi:hypothetical protein